VLLRGNEARLAQRRRPLHRPRRLFPLFAACRPSVSTTNCCRLLFLKPSTSLAAADTCWASAWAIVSNIAVRPGWSKIVARSLVRRPTPRVGLPPCSSNRLGSNLDQQTRRPLTRFGTHPPRRSRPRRRPSLSASGRRGHGVFVVWRRRRRSIRPSAGCERDEASTATTANSLIPTGPIFRARICGRGSWTGKAPAAIRSGRPCGYGWVPADARGTPNRGLQAGSHAPLRQIGNHASSRPFPARQRSWISERYKRGLRAKRCTAMQDQAMSRMQAIMRTG